MKIIRTEIPLENIDPLSVLPPGTDQGAFNLGRVPEVPIRGEIVRVEGMVIMEGADGDMLPIKFVPPPPPPPPPTVNNEN